MVENLIKEIKGKNIRIVFPEGSEPRILQAAARLHHDEILCPVLLGDPDEIKQAAQELGVDIEGIDIVDHLHFESMEEMARMMVELRRGKLDQASAKAMLEGTNYFGTMYVKMGYADGLLGGATYSTADTVRPALQLIKTKPNNSIVSSCFILCKGEERLVFGDCSINIAPTEDDLVEITMETAKTAKFFGIDPVVSLLSYSSMGSAKGESVNKVRSATQRLKNIALEYPVDGELQFDASVSPVVAKVKAPQSKVAARANVFIFPNMDAANIGYKIASRLGGYEAIGPILQGLNAPINDLSRGCTSEEVYKMAIVTAMATLIQ